MSGGDPNTYDETGVRELCDGLLGCTLPKERWTHRAHLSVTLFLIRTRDEGLERDLPGIIRRYNASVGGVNDDTRGYHETITQAYLAALRAFSAAHAETLDFGALCAVLFSTDMADSAWPLRYWSKDKLFSVPARRGWIAPDLAPLPFPLHT